MMKLFDLQKQLLHGQNVLLCRIGHHQTLYFKCHLDGTMMVPAFNDPDITVASGVIFAYTFVDSRDQLFLSTNQIHIPRM